MLNNENIAYVGLGSNLDDPILQLKKSITRLESNRGIRLLKLSSFYLTAPQGFAEQPHFVNAVVKISTKYTPHVLLTQLQHIENLQLRKRKANQNSPRTLDLDILLFNDLIYDTKQLCLPHPRMKDRRFVIEPLFEIDRHAITKRFGSAYSLLKKLAHQDCKRISSDINNIRH